MLSLLLPGVWNHVSCPCSRHRATPKFPSPLLSECEFVFFLNNQVSFIICGSHYIRKDHCPVGHGLVWCVRANTPHLLVKRKAERPCTQHSGDMEGVPGVCQVSPGFSGRISKGLTPNIFCFYLTSENVEMS